MNSIFRNMLARMRLVQQRKAKRTSAPDLEVLCEDGPHSESIAIRDISHTGVFLLTPQQIQPGAKTILTLRRKRGLQSGSAFPGVRLHAKVVRNDESGFGLALVPDGSDAHSWLTLKALAGNLAADGDTVGRFRIAAALSFLERISVALKDEVAKLMAGMNTERRDHLASIVLGWENRLEQSDLPTTSPISPVHVLEILLMGSAAEDELSHSFWAQLLASYYLGKKIDQILHFGEILSKLLPPAVRIFDAACRMTISGEQSTSEAVCCSAKELCELANLPNVLITEQHLKHLYELGLLSRLSRPKFERIEWFSMMVTPLGLELYSCCCPPGELASNAR